MLYPTHALLGILFFLFLQDHFSGGSVIVFFLIVLLFSLFPDVDEQHSLVNRMFGPIGTVIATFSKHRGIFHSVFLYVALFFLSSFFWSNYYGWAILIGYAAHLLGDVLTPMGVTLFYPVSKFRIRGMVRAGGVAEGCILVVLMVVVILMLVR